MRTLIALSTLLILTAAAGQARDEEAPWADDPNVLQVLAQRKLSIEAMPMWLASRIESRPEGKPSLTCVPAAY